MNCVLAPSVHSIDCLQVLLRLRLISASKCISRLAGLGPASMHNYGHQVHLWPRSIMGSKFAWSWPPGTYLHTHSMTGLKCIYTFAPLPPRSASPSLLNHDLRVHLHDFSITACRCITNPVWSASWSVSLGSPDRYFQVHLTSLSSTAWS